MQITSLAKLWQNFCLPIVRRTGSIVSIGSLGLLLWLTFPTVLQFGLTSLAAADAVRVAIKVNNTTITNIDLYNRFRLLAFFSGFPSDSADFYNRLANRLERLAIEESLQDAILAENSLAANEAEVTDYLSKILSQQRQALATFLQQANEAGVDRSEVLNFFKRRLLWGRYILSRYANRVRPIKSEVLARQRDIIAQLGQQRYLYSELYISDHRSGRGQTSTSAISERVIELLQRGADFTALIVDFSDAASASLQGRVGPVAVTELAPEVVASLQNMRIGEINGPFATAGGLLFVRLEQVFPPQIIRSSQQFDYLTLRPGSTSVLSAQQVMDRLGGCEISEILAQRADLELEKFTAVQKREVPETFAAIFTQPEGKGIINAEAAEWTIVQLCNREQVYTGVPQQQQLENIMLEERVARLSQELIEQAYNTAVIVRN